MSAKTWSPWTLMSIVVTISVFVAIGAVITSIVRGETIVARDVERLDNVVRVFMHAPRRYTLYLAQENSPNIAQRTITVPNFTRQHDGQFVGGSVRLITDVPANQPMWASAAYERMRSGEIQYTALEIHIHEAQEVNGAGWDHGKSGSSTTTVVE